MQTAIVLPHKLELGSDWIQKASGRGNRPPIPILWFKLIGNLNARQVRSVNELIDELIQADARSIGNGI